jgi:hypothetical protein
MNRAKTWRGSEDDDIGGGDGLLVALKANELRVIFHIDFVLVLLLEVAQRALGPVFKGVGHGHQFDIAGGAQGLVRCAGTAATAAHECDPQCVARRDGSVGKPFNRQRAQQCATGNGS